jgi:hypothetical protein
MSMYYKRTLYVFFFSLIIRPLFFSIVTVCFTGLFLRCYTVRFLHSPVFLKFHFIFFLCLSLYSHTSRKFVMIYSVISLRSVHPFAPLFFAYKLGQIISLFFSFPFISKYKFCVMLYYKYLKMKTIKIVYSLCFCFNLGNDMNSLPGSKTQPHCKYYTKKIPIKLLQNAL